MLALIKNTFLQKNTLAVLFSFKHASAHTDRHSVPGRRVGGTSSGQIQQKEKQREKHYARSSPLPNTPHDLLQLNLHVGLTVGKT